VGAALDLTVGAAEVAVDVSGAVVRRVAAVSAPVVRPATSVALRPPLLAERYHPATWVAALADRGERRLARLRREAVELLDLLVPIIAREVIGRIDLNEVVRRQVALDALVATVDLDAIARRLDVDAVVARLDLNRIVRERVDLDGLVATVDLDAVAARLDIDAVIDRIDLVGLAEAVIAEVDLPEIIRGSTGSMASETVRGVRMQGISGDDALTRVVDRFRLRRGHVDPHVGPRVDPAGDGDVRNGSRPVDGTGPPDGS